MTHELAVLLLFGLSVAILIWGYPVAFSLAGSALITASISFCFGLFDIHFLSSIPERIYGIMLNDALVSIPLFILMGLILERTKLAEDLLKSMATILGRWPAGLGLSVFIVGAILAASTGVVGATVIAMGLISLPEMLKQNYSKSVAAGIVCASGTLGQIIPPSVVLIILGDVIGSAHQQAQLSLGNYSPESVSVADLFVGAIVPGFLLVGLYILYLLALAFFKPQAVPKAEVQLWNKSIFSVLLPPLFLIGLVLGSILMGVATPTEAAAVGVVGALAIAGLRKKLKREDLNAALSSSVNVTAMVFTILIGASVFSLVFRGLEGDEIVKNFLLSLSGDRRVVLLIVMLVVFLLGFFIDFMEIVFVVVPIIGPVLLQMGYDPVWLGVVIAVNLQTSFLTPPFGFSLFYLRSVAPASVSTVDIYRGVWPYIAIQLFVILLLALFPGLVL